MQWGDEVRSAGPQGFSGPWPRFLLIHGTNDPILQGSTMIPAQTAQWTNVHGLTDADATSENNQPINGWTRKSYKDDTGTVLFEVSTGTATTGNMHDLTPMGFFPDVVRFFGLDMDPPVGSGGAGGGGGTAGAGTGGLAGGGSANGGASPGGTGGASSGAGGAPSTGGSAPAAGGASSSGGAGIAGASGGAPAGVGGASVTPSGGVTTDNGCGCRVAGAGSGTLGSLVPLAAGLGMLLRRKQRRGAKQ